jgi:hypothetical protein
MLINKPFATVLLAAAVAAAALPAGADASRTNPLAHFSVTVAGSVNESWNYTRDGASADCLPLTQGSGNAHIEFASPKAKKVLVTLYDGVKGSVPVAATSAREGSFGTTYRDAECGWHDEVSDASGCGSKSFRGRIDNFSNSRSNWGFDLSVPRDGACPTPPGSDPLAGTTTAQALHDGPKWEWQGLLTTRRRGATPKKVQTVTYRDHRVIPFTGASGQRTIDVTWKVTFKRLDAVH